MNKRRVYLLLSLVLLATGCPKYRPSVNFGDTKNLASRVNSHFATKQAEYYNALNNNNPALAKRKRNEMIEDALPFIDAAYEDFVTNLTIGRDRTNFIADVVELGTSAAIGITNGERSIQILGVALTAFRGGRRSLDLNFYREQATPILITKMDGNRARVRSVIIIREREEVETYPIGAAVSDIVAYYNAGTLVRAFTELHKDTADQTKQHEEDLMELKGITPSRPATGIERDTAVSVLDTLRALSNDLAGTEEEKAAAIKKLQAIVAELSNIPELTTHLADLGLTATEADGTKLLNGLMELKRKFAPDDPLQDRINRVINEVGNL